MPSTRSTIDTALAITAAICLAGCTDANSEAGSTDASSTDASSTDASNPTPETTVRADTTNLSRTLEAKKADFAAKADEKTKRIYDEGIDAVATSGVLEQATNVGDTAPDFTLPDAAGNDVALSSLLAQGPVVLVWYRGGWCPYCNLTLRAYQEVLPQINAAGATLVAISPELPDNALSTKEKNELDFVVVTDENNRVAREYGVVFNLIQSVHDNYNKNFNFDTWNGQSSGDLPLAATYVITQDGTVSYAFLDPDYRNRAEPADVLAALNNLN